VLVEQRKSLRLRLGQVRAEQVPGMDRLLAEKPTERYEPTEQQALHQRRRRSEDDGVAVGGQGHRGLEEMRQATSSCASSTPRPDC